jgi:thiamine-monophosphate kinase
VELELIDWLRQELPQHADVLLGPGDDAAVLRLAPSPACVVTVDLLTEGVDFLLDEVDPARIGRKALAVNLSDLAAMAAEPLAAVVALALPEEGGMQLARQLYAGMLPLAQQYGVSIIGGDTNRWQGSLVLSITALGRPTVAGPLRRSGAQPGDEILVTGSLGGSILGRHFDFEPRVAEALILNSRYQLHAGIDLSDGLSTDLAHLVQESNCGALLWSEQIPIAAAARQLAVQHDDGCSALEHALHDGEDFELLLAVAPHEAQRILDEKPVEVPLTRIGVFTAAPGLWIQDHTGQHPLESKGWEH